VKLIADGATSTQPLVVKMDPRVKTSAEGLGQQFTLSMQMYDDFRRVSSALEEFSSLQAKSRNAKFEEIAGASGDEDEEAPRAAKNAPDTLTSVAASLKTLFEALQSADVAPAQQMAAEVAQEHRAAEAILKRWAGR
jgi:hypothetical protein